MIESKKHTEEADGQGDLWDAETAVGSSRFI